MSKPNKNQPSDDGPPLRSHVFDGIQEYDNKLPNWWLFTFYIAIVFYIGYWVVYYNTDLLKSPTDRIDERMAEIDKIRADELKAMLNKLDDKVLIEWSNNQSIVDQGETIYKQHCIACHSPDLNGGVIGRSLVDSHWEYGGKPMDLFSIVLKGSPADAKGFNGQKMIPWETPCGGAENVAKVVAFVINKSPHIEKGE